MVAIVLLLMVGLILTDIVYYHDISAPIQCSSYLDAALPYDCNGTTYYAKSDTSFNVTNNTYYSNTTFYNSNGTYLGNATCQEQFDIYWDDNTFCAKGTSTGEGKKFKNCTLNDTYNDIIQPNIGAVSIGLELTVSYLFIGYVNALLRAITISPKSTLTTSHILIYLILNHCINRSGQKKRVSMEVVDRAILKIRAYQRTILTQMSVAMFGKKDTRRLQYLQSSLDAYRESFMYHISSLLFALSYGLTQITAIRWGSNVPVFQAASDRVDFGQIVPLVLLVLPFLVAVEVFYGKSLFSPSYLFSQRNREKCERLNRSHTQRKSLRAGHCVLFGIVR